MIYGKELSTSLRMFQPINMAEIPKSPIARIMKDTGVERVSEDAKVELAEALEEIARNISIKANEAAKLAKRKTIKAEDIKFAVNELDL